MSGCAPFEGAIQPIGILLPGDHLTPLQAAVLNASQRRIGSHPERQAAPVPASSSKTVRSQRRHQWPILNNAANPWRWRNNLPNGLMRVMSWFLTCQGRFQRLCIDPAVEQSRTTPIGRPMTDTRPAPVFIADNVGLDFMNTIAVPVNNQVEWLASGEDLLVWLREAGLAPKEALNTFRKNTLPGQLDALAAQARGLRDWFRPFVYKYKGRPIEAKALHELALLNQLLARDEAFGQIVVRDVPNSHDHDHEAEDAGLSGLAWRPQRRWQSPESLLVPLARSLADLVCTEDFTQVKACEGPGCTLLFLDRTRGRARRWCSMAVCGNRVKQAAHRRRIQEARKDSDY